MSLLFNTLPRLVTPFLPRSKSLFISWWQSPSTVILEPKKRKSVSTSTFPPSICHDMMGSDAIILVFWMVSFQLTFPLFSFILIKTLFSSSSLSAIRMVSSAYLRLLLFLLAIFFFFFNSFFFLFFICSRFCHTLKWNSHGFTCVPHPDAPSHLPLHPIPLGLPSAPGPSACLMHPTWAGDLFHPR